MNVLIQLLVFGFLTLVGPTGWGGGNFNVGDTTGNFCVQDSRVVFVVWADACSGGSCSVGPGDLSGSLHARDGREVAWECRTRDGRTGGAKIDGVEYDLKKGCVFLVSTRDKKTAVRQLDKDVAGIASGPKGFGGVDEALGRLAKDDEVIARFVKAGEGK